MPINAQEEKRVLPLQQSAVQLPLIPPEGSSEEMTNNNFTFAQDIGLSTELHLCFVIFLIFVPSSCCIGFISCY